MNAAQFSVALVIDTIAAAGVYAIEPCDVTAPVAVVNFMNYEGWEWGRIAAGGTMIMLPVLVFSFVVRKYLVHGLTGGALKG